MSPAVRSSAVFDVTHPSGEHTRIPIHPLPFRIGRGPENDLILRDNRVSRAHARIAREGAALVLEDLGSLHGTWINGKRIDRPAILRPGDSLHFGFDDSYQMVFLSGGIRVDEILDQISCASSQSAGAEGRFARLRTLIEMARMLQSSVAVDEVLNAVIDAALALSGTERGFLLLRSGSELEVKIGRDASGATLGSPELQIPISQLESALAERRDMLSMNVAPQKTGNDSPGIEFPNILCVPLVRFGRLSAEETMTLSSEANTVGLLYLDSRKQQAPLSGLNRELLHTLALEASTVLENAAALEEERQARILQQELEIAREMQQALLPRELPTTGWFRAVGSSLPSAEVAGDYFDVHAIGEDEWAVVIADVSGKGISAALLASLLQGAFLLGSELRASLDTLFERINHFLIQRAQREKYATLFYARIGRTGNVEWVNAGHPVPFLVRPDGEILKLESTGAPLGLLPAAELKTQQVKLEPGDKIVLYSDGLVEAQNNRRQMYEGKLEVYLKQVASLTAQQIHERLIDDVEQFREGEPLRDDVTLLVLEYCGE